MVLISVDLSSGRAILESEDSYARGARVFNRELEGDSCRMSVKEGSEAAAALKAASVGSKTS